MVRLLTLVIACSLTAAGQQVTGTAAAPINPATPITLEQAIALARTNEPVFAAAVANARVTALDHTIAQAALLPTVNYHNQFLYTQPNGAFNGSGPIGNQPS